MSRNLREALNDVVGGSTWRPDNTLVIHDAEKWTTLVGYIVMATNGDNDGQVPMGCEGAVAVVRASLDVPLQRAVLKFYADQMPAYAAAAGLNREQYAAVMVDVKRARAEYAALSLEEPPT